MDRPTEAAPENPRGGALVPWLAPIFGALLGVWLIGLHAINPLNVDWMRGDIAQVYIGWAHFRQDAEWGFPLTFTKRLSTPAGCSISYNNSNPLVAVLLKPFSPHLPKEFQYQGLFGLVAAILQAVFGYKLCRKFTGDEWKALLGSLFILTAPPFVMRYSHDLILVSHWLILAALCVCIGPPETKNYASRPFRFGLLLTIAGGITPYLSLMCLLVMGVTAYGDVVQKGRIAFDRLAIWTLPVVALVASWIVFGFLQFGDGRPQAGLGGYGEYSMNLLSPINPRYDAAGNPSSVRSILFKEQDSFSAQYEGYNYLGAGFILLMAGTLAFGRRPKLIFLDPKLRSLWAVAAISLLMAVTTKVTWGHSVLMDVPLPYYPVKQFLSSFRASGRLFWPAYYIIMIAFLQYGFRHLARRRLLLGWSLLVILQVRDTLSLHQFVRTAVNPPPGVRVLKDEFWETMPGRFNQMMVLPAWQVMPNDSTLPGGPESWEHFGLLTARHGMALNINYQARPNAKDDKFQRTVLPAAVMAGDLADDTIYVLGPRYLVDFCERNFTHIASKSVDGMLVFWKDLPKAANLETLQALREQKLQEGLDFKDLAQGFEMPTHSIPFQRDIGFSLPEAEFIYSDGLRSQIPLIYSDRKVPREVTVDIKPVVGRDITSQAFRVSLSGKLLGAYRLEKPGSITIDIPADTLNAADQSGVAFLIFDWETAARTEQITIRNESKATSALRRFAQAVGFKSGLSGDTRVWAAGIRGVRLRAEE